MSNYYRSIADRTTLSRRSGTSAVIPAGFKELSASVISSCTFAQGLLQQIIYITHGSELLEAKRTLKEFPSPKARIDFLCAFPYSDSDPVVLSAFDYARRLFRELYELRNVLAHELWASSDDHDDAVIFTSLEEEARLQMASGKIWHLEGTTSRETFDSLTRYIRSAKIVTNADLCTAMSDADLCSWILMTINGILDEQDVAKKEEARRALYKYKGTSHLFSTTPPDDTVEFRTSKSKTTRI